MHLWGVSKIEILLGLSFSLEKLNEWKNPILLKIMRLSWYFQDNFGRKICSFKCRVTMYLWEFTPISRSAQFEIVEQFPVSHPWTGNFGFASVKYSLTGSCCFASKLLFSHAMRHQIIWILTREWRLLLLLLLTYYLQKNNEIQENKIIYVFTRRGEKLACSNLKDHHNWLKFNAQSLRN